MKQENTKKVQKKRTHTKPHKQRDCQYDNPAFPTLIHIKEINVVRPVKKRKEY